MKKLLALILAGVLVASLFVGCMPKNNTEEQDITIAQDEETEAETEDDVDTDSSDTGDSFDDADNMSYIMIYNPSVFNEKSKVATDSKNTGDISKWVKPISLRADDEKVKHKYKQVDQQDLSKYTKHKVPKKLQSKRADDISAPKYKEGESHVFKYGFVDGASNSAKFKCIYEGDNCYVWLRPEDNANKDEAIDTGKEFDSKIYKDDVEMFGEPRFADQGGKINIIYEPMSDRILGYFYKLEIFTPEELIYLGAKTNQINAVNAGHPIIHINSKHLGKNEDKRKTYNTIAHEFQHLISMSDVFSSGSLKNSSTWLDEAMSTYAGNKLYNGTLELDNHDIAFMISNRIRRGQSLYNFKNGAGDIGVYGSVYLFADYLEELGGDGVFKKIHDHFRDSSTTKTDAAAIYNSLPEDVVEKIDSEYELPSGASYSSDEEEWMSKLTLDFYKHVLEQNPSTFKRLKKDTLLYDSVSAADIEGGGRIIASTKNGKFDIPSDSDSPLVYIGFDKDFKAVTKTVIK